MNPSATTSSPAEGLRLIVTGEAAHTVVMIHGWPDTHRLWDAQVAALSPRWRCARFDLPGYDLPGKPPGELPTKPRSYDLEQVVAQIAAAVDQISPQQPVTLLLHDWGAVYGYEYAARYPERVARMIGVDIGDATSSTLRRSLPLKAKLMVAGYQLWLALAWKLGQAISTRLADGMTRFMARALRAPGAPEQIGYAMNYPYYEIWTGGFRSAKPFTPHCPLLYIYGQRKPFMFHSERWLNTVQQTAGSAVVPFKTGHWVMAQQSEAFNACITQWLEQTPP